LFDFFAKQVFEAPPQSMNGDAHGALGHAQGFARLAVWDVGLLAGDKVFHRRERDQASNAGNRIEAEQALGRAGGFQLVLRERYLMLIGLLTLAAQLVNTNGNYILSATLAQTARAAVATGTAGGLSEREIIGSYMAGTDFWQNLLVVVIQLFLVSRIFKYLGVGGSLFILPTIALSGYGLFAAAPLLAVIRVARLRRTPRTTRCKTPHAAPCFCRQVAKRSTEPCKQWKRSSGEAGTCCPVSRPC
jgi:hypothetical protein